ncbi:MAG: FtsQ-type POTRA domain-containing protein, partial [Anaerotardibacter sp.]
GAAPKKGPSQGRSVQISNQSRYKGGFGNSSYTSASVRQKTPGKKGAGKAQGPYVQSSRQGRGGQNPSLGNSLPHQGAQRRTPSAADYSRSNYSSRNVSGGGFSGNQSRRPHSGRPNGSSVSGYQVPPYPSGYNQASYDRVGRPVVGNGGRPQPQAKKRIPFAGKIAIVIAVLALIVGVIAYTFVNSDSYRIKSITVEGCEHLTNQEMTSLASIPENSTLLNINEAEIVANLKKDPWIRDAHIERQFPDVLKLVVEEREICAVCDVVIDNSDTTETWALASDGMWLMKIPAKDSPEAASVASKIYEDVETVLNIKGVPYGTTPVAGEFCTNANVSNALSIIDGLSTDLSEQVKSVTASNSDSTTLTLKNGVEIAFGDSSDIRDKERVCLELLSKYENQIAYINVRVVNKPVWRSF